MERIGKKLRILRILYGYSQESVATTLNISQKSYSRLENDEMPLNLNKLAQLADLFHMEKLRLYKFLETSEKAIIQKITDTNGGSNVNDHY